MSHVLLSASMSDSLGMQLTNPTKADIRHTWCSAIDAGVALSRINQLAICSKCTTRLIGGIKSSGTYLVLGWEEPHWLPSMRKHIEFQCLRTPAVLYCRPWSHVYLERAFVCRRFICSATSGRLSLWLTLSQCSTRALQWSLHRSSRRNTHT